VEAQTVMTATSVRPLHRTTDADCRALQTDDDWKQSVELRVRCQDHSHETDAFCRFTTASARIRRELVAAGRGGWFGVFVDGRLVSQMGLISAGPGVARFQSVETDPEHRRRGLAGALVDHVSRYGLGVLGARTLVMVADPDYHAIDLYRSAGFIDAETQLQAERAPQ
jgi:ribosomal protein S18 acetylase RimI-like enzyme